jgi:hypothetical protein
MLEDRVVRAAEGVAEGKGTKRARGGFTFSVCSRTMLMDVVAIPLASSARASTPPVCVQKGMTRHHPSPVQK